MDRRMSVGGLLSEMLALIGEGIRPFAIFMVCIGGLAAVGAVFGLSEPGRTFQVGLFINGSRSPLSILYQLAEAAVSVVAGYLLIAQFLKIRGRLTEGSPRIFAYLGLSILFGLGVVLGVLLLIVPGLILLVRWSAAPGFLIGRRERVIDSFSRSWEATKGHGWTIFFAGLLMIIGASIVGGIAGAAIGGIGYAAGIPTAVPVASAIGGVFGSGLNAAFTAAVFVLSHDDHDELGEVFE